MSKVSDRQLPAWKLLLLLVPTAGFILFFIGVVGYMVVVQSLGLYNPIGSSRFSLEHWEAALRSPQTWDYFFYSLRQGLLSALGAVFCAYPFALWLRRPFRGSVAITGILRIPMLIPGLVAAFLFINVIAYHGFFNEIMVLLGLFSEPRRMQNDAWGLGVLVLQVWKNMPFALLLLTGAGRGISDEVLDAARDLGAKRYVLFWRIIFPLTLNTMRAALLIIFIGALGDFSFNVVAGPRALQSMSQYMVVLANQFFEVGQAAVVTILMIIASLIGTGILIFFTRIFAPQARRVEGGAA